MPRRGTGWPSINQPVSLSRGTDSPMVTPSGFQTRTISPPSWSFTVARASRVPNPSPCVTVGPPRSLHVRMNCCSSSEHSTATRPLDVERAPYLAALVANSCNSKARLRHDAARERNVRSHN